MVTAQETHRAFDKIDLVAEEQAAPAVLHHQHKHQQENHRELGGQHRGVLGEAVIPEFGLPDMQPDKQQVETDRDDIHRVQGAAVSGAFDLGPGNQCPQAQLVQAVE